MSSTRGPLPKRDADRAGHNAKSEQADKVKKNTATAMPAAPDEWCDLARDWYTSLAESGESTFYEPSDWQYALVVGQMLHSLLIAPKPSSEMFKAVDAAMDKLGVTESSRRRQRIEVHRPKGAAPVDPNATSRARDRIESLRAAT